MGWVSSFWMSDVHIGVGILVIAVLVMVTVACIIVQIDTDFRRSTQRNAARILLLMPVAGPLLVIFWITILPFAALFYGIKVARFLFRRAEFGALFKTGVTR